MGVITQTRGTVLGSTTPPKVVPGTASVVGTVQAAAHADHQHGQDGSSASGGYPSTGGVVTAGSTGTIAAFAPADNGYFVSSRSLATTGALPAQPAGMDQQGPYVYVALEGAGTNLQIVDIRTPTAPVLRGTLGGLGGGNGIRVIGAYAYITTGTNLRVVNVSDPTAPTLTGTLALSGATGIAVTGTTAFVTRGTSIEIVDVSTPTAPASLGSIALASARAVNLSADGATLFVNGSATAGGRDTIYIYDVSTPAAPVLRGSLVDAVHFVTRNTLVSQNDTLWVGSASYLTAVDITDPTAPAVVGAVAAGPSGGADGALGFAIQGNYAYGSAAAGAFTSFGIYDLSDRTNPSVVRTVALGANTVSAAVVAGDVATIAYQGVTPAVQSFG